MDNHEDTRVDRLISIIETLVGHQLPLPLKGVDQPPTDPPDPPPHGGPFQNDDLNTYRGFRAFWQNRERIQAPHVKTITRRCLTNWDYDDSEKTLLRGMNHYHLTQKTGLRTFWPPSTWPEEEPPANPGPSPLNKALLLASSLAGARLVAQPCLLHLQHLHHLLHHAA